MNTEKRFWELHYASKGECHCCGTIADHEEMKSAFINECDVVDVCRECYAKETSFVAEDERWVNKYINADDSNQ